MCYWLSGVLRERRRNADKLKVLGAAAHHVGDGSITLVSWGRVFAGDAGMVDVDVASVRPAIVGVVVTSCGSGWSVPGLVGTTINNGNRGQTRFRDWNIGD